MNHVSLQKLLESRTDQSSENSMAMAEFRTAILQAAARVEFEAAEQLDPDQLDIFRRHTEILYKYAIAGYNLSEAQSDQLLEALAIAHSYETTFGTRGLTPSEDLKGGASTFRSVTYQIAKNVMIFSSQVPMYELVADEIGAEQLLIPDTRIQQGPLFPTDSKLLISTISFTFDPGQHFSELLAAIQCDHLLINRRDSEVLLEQWRVSLTPFGTKYAEIIGSLKEGFLVVIRERELSLELSRADVVAGLYIMQFADGVSRGRASPTLFNQVERHLEESAIDDPVRWAAARYQIAAG